MPNILPDLTAKRGRSIRTNRVYLRRELSDPMPPAMGVQRDPILREAEAVETALERVAARRARVHDVKSDTMVLAPNKNRRRKPVRSFYRPKDGSQDGAPFMILDRATGTVLARVRGTFHHCMGEMAKFAAAQGEMLSALKLEVTHDGA